MQTTTFTISEGTIAEAVFLSHKIPEFLSPHGPQVYHERLHNREHLILIAYQDGMAVGFKVGYAKENDGSFYSWMGGVLPDYRRYGIARGLAEWQESWAKAKGYTKVRFKTRNCHSGMLHFALGRGFHITGFLPMSKVEQHRIILEKPI